MRNALDSSPTVTNCTFTSNSARSGGAMDNYSGSSPAVTNCTFTGNTAESGGGMHNGRNCSPAVTNCTFTGNTADSGGGMRSYLDSSPTVVGCTFSDNRAREYGGGMDNIGSLSPLVSGCIFVGNTAGVGGGGMSNGSSSPALTNCTFSGNRAASYGGGMSCAYSFPTVANCILWGNSAPDGPEIWTASNASCTVTYSCIAQSDGFTDGGGNFDLDPLFVDPGHWDDNGTPGDDTDDIWIDGDYRLQPGSPCIDRADGDAAPEFDIEGNHRHDDPGMPDIGRGSPDHVDIGAYEFQGHSRITPFAGGCMPVSGGCGGWLAGLAVLAAFASALRRRLA